MDAQLGGGMTGGSLVSRSFVSNIYKAKLGEILKPEKVDNNYIVAIVTEVNEEGTQSVERARAGIELELRKRKKAEIIKQKIGTVTTLEDVAAKLGKPIEAVDSLRMDVNTFTPQLGAEPKVKGAAFNPSNKGKVVQPIAGVSGVYVIRVESVGATAIAANVAEIRKGKYTEKKAQASGPMDALKKIANIKDKRAEKF
jgi:peptidyl-prolyl cis-trans isomerase D